MDILAIDPGSSVSHWICVSSQRRPLIFGSTENEELTGLLRRRWGAGDTEPWLVVEMLAPRGMPTAAEELETCVWIGRFIESWVSGYHVAANAPPRLWRYISRAHVKLAICGNTMAKDSNVRQALIDAYGGKEAAIGKKAQPGPLYGIANDVWQALAIGKAALCANVGLGPWMEVDGTCPVDWQNR